MPNNNPRLKNNTIVETLLEFKFNPIPNFNLKIGEIYLELKDKYPISSELQAFDLPSDPVFNSVPLYRFTDDTGKSLVNLGRGILSINTLDYTSFTSFLKDIQEVLPKLVNKLELVEVTQIALRYINKVEVNNEIKDYFTIKYDLPKQIGDVKGFAHRTTTEFDDGKLLLTFNTQEALTSSPIILDLQFYKDQVTALELENTYKWIKNSHQIIYETFISCITKDFYNSLLND